MISEYVTKKNNENIQRDIELSANLTHHENVDIKKEE